MSSVIKLNKIDHTTIQIETERSIEAELRDAFSFYVPNYQFMPKFKHGMWDGKLYLYNVNQKSFPAGLYSQLIDFCRKRDYSLQIDPISIPFEYHGDLSYDLDIPLTTRGEEIELRDYQFNAINHIIQNRRGLLLSPTGSGKSLIIYALMRYFEDQRFLLVVPTTALVEQMYSDFADYSEMDSSFNVNENTVHRIYSGHEKDFGDKRIVISTWQSIHNLPPSWFHSFDGVIGDEAHTFKAKSLNKIMNSCVNASIRVGTTGTLDNMQINQLVLIGLFGDIFKATTTKELIDENTLSKTHINVLNVTYDKDTCLDYRKLVSSYAEEMAYLTQLRQRNRMICKLALSQKKNTLLLFNYVENHGKPLFKMINEMNSNSNRKIFYIAGEINAEKREMIRKIMETENDAILVASMGTFSTGVNIRNLHNIIFSAPTKSQIRVLQSIGRGLRKHGENSQLTIYDIVDDLSDNRKKKNFAFKHGVERLKIYVKEQFEYSMHNLKI